MGANGATDGVTPHIDRLLDAIEAGIDERMRRYVTMPVVLLPAIPTGSSWFYDALKRARGENCE